MAQPADPRLSGPASDKKGRKARVGLDAAVEDASRLLFEIDGALPLDTADDENHAPQKSKQAAPHYHDHRTRLRAKFTGAGADALADYELLEMLLFRIIPRRDTKPLAKALIERFGDLAAVLGAPAQRIAEVSGAGEAVAQDLKLIAAVMARAARGEFTQKPIITSWTQLVAYCKMTMAHAPREQFRVLFLDIKNQLIADEVLNEGTINHAPVYPREVARRALELSAASVILVHNHPSGDPKPSQADKEITQDIIRAADAIGVKVHDHLVIGKAGVASLKMLGLM
jgi:DNA repair protein RadC